MSRPKGSKLSIKHKQKISDSLKGNKNCLNLHWQWNQTSKENRSKFWKGKTWSINTQFVKGQLAWNKGKKMPESMSKKMAIIASSRIGNKSANWQGGLSFIPYTPEFNDKLKVFIRKRDKYICQSCNKYGNAVHHIDYDKKNCNPDNLITLCLSCNAKVNFKREYYTKYFANKELGSVLSP